MTTAPLPFQLKKMMMNCPSETHQQKWQYMAIYGVSENWAFQVVWYQTSRVFPNCSRQLDRKGSQQLQQLQGNSVFNWSIGVTYKIHQTDLFFFRMGRSYLKFAKLVYRLLISYRYMIYIIFAAWCSSKKKTPWFCQGKWPPCVRNQGMCWP